MNANRPKEAATMLVLQARNAAELMTPNPLSIRADALVSEAVAFLTDKGFSAAPVIDRAGRPVGVLSRADLVVHEREQKNHPVAAADYYQHGDLSQPGGVRKAIPPAEGTTVREIMTPVVFSVAPDASARRVVEHMVGLKVHRLFVIDPDGILIGVISALDILRNLLVQEFVPEAAAAGK